MIRLGVAVVMVAAVALPAQAHTEAEQRQWKDDWIEKVQARGLTPSRLAEFFEFEQRHLPPVVRPTQSPRPSGNRGMGSGVEKWRGLVAAYFSDVDRALCIMSHESGGNPNARNPSSGAAGLFQVMPFWWEHYGGDRYDPETNVRVAAVILAQQGWSAWSPWKRGACR